jgi:uncharacterized protein (TIGR03435 family)
MCKRVVVNMRVKAVCLAVAIWLAAAMPMGAQAPEAFDVASVKLNKTGLRLQETSDSSTAPEVHKTAQGFSYKATPLSPLSLVLSQQVGRTVVDKTGLSGRYDFSLQYALERTARGTPEGPEPAADPDGLPSVYTALQEQLGLKLESQKGQVEFIVVDRAERPTDNQ